jgi:hypothetical protein
MAHSIHYKTHRTPDLRPQLTIIRKVQSHQPQAYIRPNMCFIGQAGDAAVLLLLFGLFLDSIGYDKASDCQAI